MSPRIKAGEKKPQAATTRRSVSFKSGATSTGAVKALNKTSSSGKGPFKRG